MKNVSVCTLSPKQKIKVKKKEVYLKKKKAVVTLTRVNGMRVDFPHIAEGCKESPF